MPAVQECIFAADGSLVYTAQFPGVYFAKTTPTTSNATVPILSTTFGFWSSELPLLALLCFAVTFCISMNLVFKMMDFVLKMMDFVFKMMDLMKMDRTGRASHNDCTATC